MRKEAFMIIILALIPIIAGFDVVMFGQGKQTFGNYLIMCSFEYLIFFSGVAVGETKLWEEWELDKR